MYLPKEKGFTLVELLVTVAIISVISATATANFSEYRQRAYDTKAVAYQREMIAATENILADIDESAKGDFLYISWLHTANGVDSYFNNDDRMRQYISLPADPDIFFLFWLNPVCTYGHCPGGDSHVYMYTNVGHCHSTASSDSQVNYNVRFRRVGGTTTQRKARVDKDERGCI